MNLELSVDNKKISITIDGNPFPLDIAGVDLSFVNGQTPVLVIKPDVTKIDFRGDVDLDITDLGQDTALLLLRAFAKQLGFTIT